MADDPRGLRRGYRRKSHAGFNPAQCPFRDFQIRPVLQWRPGEQIACWRRSGRVIIGTNWPLCHIVNEF